MTSFLATQQLNGINLSERGGVESLLGDWSWQYQYAKYEPKARSSRAHCPRTE